MSAALRWICPECGEQYDTQGACSSDASPLESGDDPLLGQFIGNYRITKLLNAEGMGRVYRATQPSIGARVAVKVLSADLGQNRELVERFFAEARAVNIIRHEQIINIVDLSRLPDGRPYIVMEYLEGAPLSGVMRHWGTLPLGSFAQLVCEVLDALGAAHQRGIIHRDLKPHNIFVSPQGRAKVLDFGIAKLDPGLGGQTSATSPGQIMGTPAYMAPEQALARPVDARTDIYAMGIILYEGICGRVPFISDSMFGVLHAHLESPPRPPRQLREDLPEAYEAIILKALAKNPTQRFQSVDEMAAALAQVARNLGPEHWVPLSPGKQSTGGAPSVTPALRLSSGIPVHATPSPMAATIQARTRPGNQAPTQPTFKRNRLLLPATVALLLSGVGIVAFLAGGGRRTSALPSSTSAATPARPVQPAPPPKNPDEGELAKPTLHAVSSEEGYIVNFVFARPPLELAVRVDPEPKFASTGDNPDVRDAAGNPTAKTWIMLPPGTRATPIEVKYRTGAGWQGPIQLAFDPDDIAVREAKEALDTFPRWVEIRDKRGRQVASFAVLVNQRSGIEKVDYGFDENEPTQRLKEGERERDIPRKATFLTVRVTFRDGSHSEIRRFELREGEARNPDRAAELPATGVAECDAVIQAMAACYRKVHGPETYRDSLKGLGETADNLASSRRKGTPEAELVETCKAMHAHVRKVFASQGCE